MNFKKYSQIVTVVIFLLFIIAMPVIALNIADIYLKQQAKLPGVLQISGATNFFQQLSQIQASITDHVAILYSKACMSAGKLEMNNFTIVKDENGGLNYAEFKPVDYKEIHKAAAFLKEQKKMAKEKPFIVISPPVKPLSLYTNYKDGLPALDLNQSIDAFLYYLLEYGVNYIDVRNLISSDAFPPEQMLYKTDLLWTSQAAFASFKKLLENIREQFTIDLDPDNFYSDSSNYNFKFFEKFFLGKLGRITGESFAGRDNFTAIWPKFKNNYSVEIIDPHGGLILKSGDCLESIFNMSSLSDDSAQKFLPNSFYLSSNASMISIKNISYPERPRILLIHDEYGFLLGSFLAPLSGELTMLNALAEKYQANISKYIYNDDYDLVIILASVLNWVNILEKAEQYDKHK